MDKSEADTYLSLIKERPDGWVEKAVGLLDNARIFASCYLFRDGSLLRLEQVSNLRRQNNRMN